MAHTPNSPMSARQCATRSGAMDMQLYLLYQPEVVLPTGHRQEVFHVPLMLCWPTFINMTRTPVTFNPQMTPSTPCVLSQPMIVPCLFSNVIQQPRAMTAPLVQPPPILVSNISSQAPGTATEAPVICAQSNRTSNQIPEVCIQDPVACDQGICSAEEDRQKVMDAAEALLILHNSPHARRETCSTPGPEESEDRGCPASP